MLHELDPFVRLASDIIGISYEEGEEMFEIKDKHLIVAALGIRNENPRKYYAELYPYDHLFRYDGRAIIDTEEAARLDKYYRLTDNLDGKFPFFRVTDATYKDSDHVSIPGRISKTLGKLFYDEGFIFVLMSDYNDPETVLRSIHSSCRELNEAIKEEQISFNFKFLAAIRDFLPQFNEHFSGSKRKGDFAKIQSFLAEIEYHQEEIRRLAIFVQHTALSLADEEP